MAKLPGTAEPFRSLESYRREDVKNEKVVLEIPTDSVPPPSLAIVVNNQVVATGADILSKVTEETLSEEALEILVSIGSGMNPTRWQTYTTFAGTFYTNPSLAKPTGELYTEAESQYKSRGKAIRAAAKHLREALTFLGKERQERDADACVIDVELITQRLHGLLHTQIERFNALSPTDTPGMERLTKSIHLTTTNLSAICGRPIQANVKIQGDPNNPVQHHHTGEITARNAYSSWDGGTTDLSPIIDAQFTEDLVGKAVPDEQLSEFSVIDEEEE